MNNNVYCVDVDSQLQTMKLIGRGVITGKKIPPFDKKGANALYNLLGKEVSVIILENGKSILETECMLITSEQELNSYKSYYNFIE